MPGKLKNYPDISIDIKTLSRPVSFTNIFGRCSPVHVEIGSGKGTFLVAQAGKHPEIDFLGIEWANKYYRHAVDRLGRWQINNVKMLRTDASDFLAEYIPEESVDCFHIYFPDPWPKKRHHKRRLINIENTANIIRCLKKNGRLQLATDHEDYFVQMTETIEHFIQQSQIKQTDFLPPASAKPGEIVGTNYERKYRKQGRTFNHIAIIKTA